MCATRTRWWRWTSARPNKASGVGPPGFAIRTTAGKQASERSESGAGRGSVSRSVREWVAVMAMLAGAILSAAIDARQPSKDDPQAVLDAAVDDFLAGRVAESVRGFDRVAALVPAAAPQLWQRGIALYYIDRYADCRAQFESHRTVNPADVENAAWHFLCVARAESAQAARARLLPVGQDPRRPMPEVYEMFQGKRRPEDVLAAAGSEPRAQFYAALYVGLYFEGIGDTRAREYIAQAASDRFADAGGYMNRVARVHMQVRGWTD